jgi:hypothetical protein
VRHFLGSSDLQLKIACETVFPQNSEAQTINHRGVQTIPFDCGRRTDENKHFFSVIFFAINLQAMATPYIQSAVSIKRTKFGSPTRAITIRHEYRCLGRYADHMQYTILVDGTRFARFPCNDANTLYGQLISRCGAPTSYAANVCRANDDGRHEKIENALAFQSEYTCSPIALYLLRTTLKSDEVLAVATNIPTTEKYIRSANSRTI